MQNHTKATHLLYCSKKNLQFFFIQILNKTVGITNFIFSFKINKFQNKNYQSLKRISPILSGDEATGRETCLLLLFFRVTKNKIK